ncbi:hypothetical protein IFM89_022823 [Coptis chinensis]|uniref:Uncharacterized protein n=1 Tax=Coptis chinensis TaxID=261450 RepID=A0A835LW87_9MAGN|nr:hypothetical protein IFM89_022823 [Coptis chinensis]
MLAVIASFSDKLLPVSSRDLGHFIFAISHDLLNSTKLLVPAEKTSSSRIKSSANSVRFSEFGHPIPENENRTEFALDLIRELEVFSAGTSNLVEFNKSWENMKRPTSL